jgi:UDP-N-acetyl-D-glucosamine dehydrogenase
VETIPPTREHPQFQGKRSVVLDAGGLAGYNAVLIATDHDSTDYALVAKHSRLVIDTRNVMARRGLASASICKA